MTARYTVELGAVDGLPYIIDTEDRDSAPYFTPAVAQSVADDLNAGVIDRDMIAWTSEAFK